MNRIDPDGRWDVKVHVYRDRTEYGYGVAVVSDNKGNEVYRFDIRAEGVGGHNRMVENSDTPLGTYDIPDNSPWISGGSRLSYGPYPRLAMKPISGEIVDSGRDLIRIHGGRQDIYNTTEGKWEKSSNIELRKTNGCLRAYDDDMLRFKAITDTLTQRDPAEIPGSVQIIDDLERDQYSNYYIPGER